MENYTYNFKVNPWRRFFNLIRVDSKQIINVYIYAIFSGLVSLSLPLGIQAIINFIMGGQISVSWVVLVGLVLAGVMITGVMQIYQLTITENIEQKIFVRASFEFAYRIPRLNYAKIGDIYLPELVNRFFDTLTVQKGLGKLLLDFSTYSIQIIFGLILLSFYHPFFIIFSLILLAVVFLIFKITGPKGLITSLHESKYKYQVVHWLEEIARNIETFKMSGGSELTLNRNDELTSAYIDQRKKHFSVLKTQYYLMVAFKVLIVAGLLIIGGLLVLDQQINIGQFVAAEIVILLLMGSVEKLILNIDVVYDTFTALEKLGNVTDIELEQYDRDESMPKEEGKSIEVELINVGLVLQSQARHVVKDVNIKIPAGEKWCIIGPTDAGKSLVLKLIAGFYDNYDGSILFNGISIANLSFEKMRSKIGNAANTEGVFMGTILENITLGRDVSIDEVYDAANRTTLAKDISSIRNGFNHKIDYEEHPLSKEIINKIILTRALINNPKLVLYDDTLFSGTKEQKEHCWNELVSKQNPFTLLAISNNINFIKKCEKVVIMEDGVIVKIVESGSLDHDDWFKNNFKV